MTLTTLDLAPALIVIDLQNGVVEAPTVHPTAEIVERSASLAAAFRRHGLPVVLVNVTGGAPGRTERTTPPGDISSPGLGRPCRRTRCATGRPPRHQAAAERLPRHWARRSSARPRRHPGGADWHLDHLRRRVHRPLRVRPRPSRRLGNRRYDRHRSRCPRQQHRTHLPQARRNHHDRRDPRHVGEDEVTLLGTFLKNRRGRDSHSAWNRPNLQGPELLIVTSERFGEGEEISLEHAGKRVGGNNLSPDLTWSPSPPETTELLLVVEDLDVPTSKPAVHCLALIDPSRLDTTKHLQPRAH